METTRYFILLFLQKIGYCLFFILYKVFVNLKIVGRENLNGLKGPIILASNHTSELDVTAIPLIFPFFSHLHPIYFVTNSRDKFKTFGLRGYLYQSGFLRLLGGYSIHSGQKDYTITLKDHLQFLRNNKTVCIFPEGRRTKDGSFGPAHGGLGYLAYATKATIVPIAINTFFGFSLIEFFKRRKKVIITIGKPIKGEKLTKIWKEPRVENFQDTAQKILDEIRKMMHNFH